MSKYGSRLKYAVLALTVAIAIPGTSPLRAQSFDFQQLRQRANEFSVVVDLELQISFGAHSTEQQGKYLGTIVTGDGLVIFDGSDLLSDNALSAYSGFDVKTNPLNIEMVTMDGRHFSAEYVGVDRYSRLAFARIITEEPTEFPAVVFTDQQHFKVGDWLALFMLLPDFIQPSLAADIGMLSVMVESPEPFPLTIGFSPLQLTSVLFSEAGEPVGILGTLLNPSDANGGGAEAFASYGMPLLGVITAERLQKLIDDPPTRGEVERGWLGIKLQALTGDMAEYWGLDVAGGIIINEIIKNSPAETAGLRVGDVIYEVNGKSVSVDREENLPVFQREIAEMLPGESVELAALRPGESSPNTIKVIVTLARAPIDAADSPEYKNEALEFTVRDLVFSDYMFFQRDQENFSGVFVSGLEQGGLAEVGGLRYGDVIQRIGVDQVSTVEEAESIMMQLEDEAPSEVIFFVWRNSKTMFVNVKTDWQ